MLTKFQWDISMHGWDKTTSGFWKRTAALLEFYFRFRFWPNLRHSRLILHRPTKFRPNRTTLCAELWRHIDFSWWRPATILYWIWVILDHPRSAVVGLSSILVFCLDWIFRFGDIAIFIFWRFGLKLPIQGHCWAVWGHIPPNDVTHRHNPQKAPPYAETRRLSHKAWKSVQRFDLGAFPRKKR